jgi:CO/xanthine dehydrogenase FAD-binding subunit
MKDFEYFAPRTLEEALRLLDEKRGSARLLAGGTDLIVQMKAGRVSPSSVIDTKKIPELNRLDYTSDSGLFVGAAVPVSTMNAFPVLASKYGLLLDACSLIGSFQLRSRATVGGNICNAAPSADAAPPLLCIEARAVAASMKGSRTIPMTDFFVGPGINALAPDELLVGIEIPPPPGQAAGSYLRHIPRQEMDIAVVGVASLLRISPENGLCMEARIALGAVAPTPIRAPAAESALVGTDLANDILEKAAYLASESARPITDMRGSEGYRREIVRVLTRRTLAKAMSLITGGPRQDTRK